VGLAVLAYFMYTNLLAAARVWIEKEQPAGQFGLWWIHLLVLAIAAALLWSELNPGRLRWKWRWRRAART
jgi:lipopolysaccharide export LptBFGC system permease protein LptF